MFPRGYTLYITFCIYRLLITRTTARCVHRYLSRWDSRVRGFPPIFHTGDLPELDLDFYYTLVGTLLALHIEWLLYNHAPESGEVDYKATYPV
ncbi:hypothetical protein F5B19DRAFT_472071 [Rostrohypoxylon terebratum]|nr:hypothetical protein F5B19DRAFT_472071 [Rostrohypoxylon terebratum]